MQGVWSLDDKNDKEGAFDIMIEDSGNGLWHVMGQTFSKVDSSRNEKIANFAQKLEETIFFWVPMNLPRQFAHNFCRFEGNMKWFQSSCTKLTNGLHCVQLLVAIDRGLLGALTTINVYSKEFQSTPSGSSVIEVKWGYNGRVDGKSGKPGQVLSVRFSLSSRLLEVWSLFSSQILSIILNWAWMLELWSCNSFLFYGNIGAVSPETDLNHHSQLIRFLEVWSCIQWCKVQQEISH